jgi:hypothetical protein
MKKLSKQLESRLMTAIEKAPQHVNEGDDPNTAIVKAAQEHSIPAGSIHLMVHAYNTGRTTRQRRDAESCGARSPTSKWPTSPSWPRCSTPIA